MSNKPSRTIRWDDPAYSNKSSEDSSSMNSLSNSSVGASLPVGNSIVKSVSVGPSAVTSTSWRELKTRDGRAYYYNSVTQKTVWEMPKEYADYLEFTQRGLKGKSVSSDSEGDVVFWDVLRERRVTSKWTWEEALRAIITHSNYKCIPTLQERKASFQRYCEAMRSVEEEEARFESLARKEAFKAMLVSDASVTSDTKWSEAVDKFSRCEAFLAISSSKERVQLFEEYQSELRRSELESVWEQRKANSVQISELLKSMNLCIDVEHGKVPDWSVVKEQIIGRVPGAESMEYLLAFEDHVKELLTELQARRRVERQAELLREVEHREAFKRLLQSLAQQEIITPFSTWSTTLPFFADSREYCELLNDYLYGSCAIDVFYDVLDQVQQLYMQERSRITEHFMCEFKSCDAARLPRKLGSFTQFKDLLSQALQLDGPSVRFAFVELYGPDSLTRDRNAINAYKHLLKHQTDPPVQLHESWKSVRERIKDAEEFKAVVCEEDLELYFMKFKKWLAKHDESQQSPSKASRWDKRSRDEEATTSQKRQVPNNNNNNNTNKNNNNNNNYK